MRWIAVLFLLISSPIAMASYPEDRNFVESQPDLVWPVGSQDYVLNLSDELRINSYWTYPAMEQGRGTEIANNGPFPILLWYPDEDEERFQYSWLGDELAKRGVIMVVSDFLALNDDYKAAQISNQIWRSISSMNSEGGDFEDGISINHWAIGGHGMGASSAALANSGWNLSDSPPRGLIGLGIDISEIEERIREVDFAPNAALFMTGTVDEIAPASEHVTPFVENWLGGWQVMHVRGANHVQYQEDIGLVEGFLDGDATMDKERQQSHAIDHILPYLNLTLRAEDDEFIKAFNREEDTSIPSDKDAHLVEDLSNARLLNVHSLNNPPGPLNYDDTFEFSAQATRRDGTELELSRTSCLVGELIFEGSNLSCSVPMRDISPGEHVMRMEVNALGMTGFQETTFVRSNTDLELMDPLPIIRFDQSHSGNVTIAELVTDPDGSDIWFENASLLGETNRLSLNLNPTEIVISHYNDSEWQGEVLLNVWIRTNQDDLNVSLRVIVDPVDDSVVQHSTIPRIELTEDDSTFVIDLEDYVSDPEFGSLHIDFVQNVEGLYLGSNGSDFEITPNRDYSGVSVFDIEVSDGTTSPITVELTVVVESVPDPIEVNQSAWQIELDEDGALSIPLDSFGYEPDGEKIEFTLSERANVTTMISGDNLMITPDANWYGTDEKVWLNLSSPDSEYSELLHIEVKPVSDPPQIIIQVAALDELTITSDWVISDADSGDMPNLSFSLDSVVLDAIPSCSVSGIEWTCHALFEVPANHSGGSSLFVITVDDGVSQSSDSRQLMINMPLGDDVSEETSFIADNMLVIVMVALILLIVGLMITKKKPPEPVSHELEEEKYGLLARAEMSS